MVADKKPGIALVRSADQLLSAGRIRREWFLDERVHPACEQLQAEGHMRCVRRLSGQEERVSHRVSCETTPGDQNPQLTARIAASTRTAPSERACSSSSTLA